MKNFLSTQLKDLMRSFHQISQDRPVRELVHQLLDHKIHEALVVNGEGQPVGVVTRTDILRHSIQFISHKTKTEAYRKEEDGTLVPLMPKNAEVLEIRKIMSPKIFSFGEKATVEEALEFMKLEGLQRVFIRGTSPDDIRGVVGIRDILNALLASRPSEEPN